MNPVELVTRRADRAQQRSRPLGFAVAVVRKFGDDKGGQLAAQLTYYGFLSLLPLLLLLVTVLGVVAGSHPAWAHRVEHSALAQFPVVGNQLGTNIHALHRRGVVGIVVGVVGLVWGSQGAMQSAQFAMAEIWNIPHVARPGYWARLGRSMATVAALGLFLVVTTVVAGRATLGGGTWIVPAAVALSLVVNTALFASGFRLLTPGEIPLRNLVTGTVVGGVGWTVLQFAGGALVAHTLRNSSQVYGFFAVVLGLLAWIYLGAQLVLYAAEINVVRARRLWPRSLVQPPLTAADRQVLRDLALEERRRPEQSLQVSFDPPAPEVDDRGVAEEPARR